MSEKHTQEIREKLEAMKPNRWSTWINKYIKERIKQIEAKYWLQIKGKYHEHRNT